MSFGIVHNNRVIVGPMEWRQKYFTDVLKIRHQITANIPGEAPQTLPLVIDSDTAIYRVIENKSEIDFMTEYHYGPLWEITSDAIIANYEVKDIEIADARNNFKIIAANKRYNKEVSGLKITVNGVEVSVDTSREGRNLFIQKLLVMADDEVVNWKFPESWLELSKNDLKYIISQSSNYIQSAFDWEKNINNAIDAAISKSELKGINME